MLLSFFIVDLVLVTMASTVQPQRNCGLGRYVTSRGCELCPKGTYSDDRSNATSCKLCPENTYASVRGLVSKTLCLRCSRTEVSPAGSAECTPCQSGFVRTCNKCVRCPPGTPVLGYRSCSCGKCDRNYIAPDWNTKYCDRCPDGTVANANHTKCNPVRCPDGYYFDGYECFPCEYNRYRNGSMLLCEECPFGTVTNNLNGPNPKCIQCPAGSYTTDLLPQTNTFEQSPLCLKCPPNSTTRGAGKSLCRRWGSKCAPNSVVDFDKDCLACDYNQRVQYSTRTCVPCREGYAAPRGALKRCLKCAKGATGGYFGKCFCKAGFGMQNGVCRPCLKGTVSPENANECLPCWSISVAPRNAMSQCTACPHGTRTIGKDRTKCVKDPKCGPGSILRNHDSIANVAPSCVSMRTGCEAGLERVKLRGRTVCVDRSGKVACPSGSVFDNVNKCVSCTNSRYLSKSFPQGRLVCKKCGAGTISQGGTVRSCTQCPEGFSTSHEYDRDISYCYCDAGKYIRANTGACENCPEGSVNNAWNATHCEKCANGYIASNRKTCECIGLKVIDRDGNCVEDPNRLDYPPGWSQALIWPGEKINCFLHSRMICFASIIMLHNPQKKIFLMSVLKVLVFLVKYAPKVLQSSATKFGKKTIRTSYKKICFN